MSMGEFKAALAEQSTLVRLALKYGAGGDEAIEDVIKRMSPQDAAQAWKIVNRIYADDAAFRTKRGR